MTYNYNLEYLTGTHTKQVDFPSAIPVNRHDVVEVEGEYFLVLAVSHSETDGSALWLGESCQSVIEAQLPTTDNAELSEFMLSVLEMRRR